MAEHLPHKMEETQYPQTPYHPRFAELSLVEEPEYTGGAVDVRIAMQLLYNAVNLDFVTQFAVVRAMRFVGKPSPSPPRTDPPARSCLPLCSTVKGGLGQIASALGAAAAP